MFLVFQCSRFMKGDIYNFFFILHNILIKHFLLLLLNSKCTEVDLKKSAEKTNKEKK